MAASVFGQSTAPATVPAPVPAAPAVAEVQPDLSDPGVIRAQQNLDRTRDMVQQGAMPMNKLARAQDDYQDALDMSILRYSSYTRDLLPEQADQMVTVAERMLLRRQKRVAQARQLAASGVKIGRAHV